MDFAFNDEVWVVAARLFLQKLVTPMQVEAWVAAQRPHLTAADFHNKSVIVTHEDGSVMSFNHALAVKLPGYWAVFTEHHGYFWYAATDATVRAFGRPVVIPAAGLHMTVRAALDERTASMQFQGRIITPKAAKG